MRGLNQNESKSRWNNQFNKEIDSLLEQTRKMATSEAESMISESKSKAESESQKITQDGESKVAEIQQKIDSTFDSAVDNAVSTSFLTIYVAILRPKVLNLKKQYTRYHSYRKCKNWNRH